MSDPASYHELTAGLDGVDAKGGADARFLCEMLAYGQTLAEARQAWGLERERRERSARRTAEAACRHAAGDHQHGRD